MKNIINSKENAVLYKIFVTTADKKAAGSDAKGIGQVLSIKMIIFLLVNLNICFGCSKEPYHWAVLLNTHNICFG